MDKGERKEEEEKAIFCHFSRHDSRLLFESRRAVIMSSFWHVFLHSWHSVFLVSDTSFILYSILPFQIFKNGNQAAIAEKDSKGRRRQVSSCEYYSYHGQGDEQKDFSWQKARESGGTCDSLPVCVMKMTYMQMA